MELHANWRCSSASGCKEIKYNNNIGTLTSLNQAKAICRAVQWHTKRSESRSAKAALEVRGESCTVATANRRVATLRYPQHFCKLEKLALFSPLCIRAAHETTVHRRQKKGLMRAASPVSSRLVLVRLSAPMTCDQVRDLILAASVRAGDGLAASNPILLDLTIAAK